MKEACIGGDQTFIADDQAAEVAQPREDALDDPPSPVAPQLTAVLVRGPLMVGAGGMIGSMPRRASRARTGWLS